MTIPATLRRAGPYVGNDVQTVWPFAFKVFVADDVAVTVADVDGVETLLTEGADYSVFINPDQETSPGGTITYPLGGPPLATGAKLVAVGDTPYDQPLDLPSGGNFSPRALENQLDRTIMQVQQLEEKQGRALTAGPTNDANLTLPGSAQGMLIGWNDDGTALINYPMSASPMDSSSIFFRQLGTGAVPITLEKNDRDWVSVTQFGAVGDGVTDDRTKIQAALDAHSEVYLPDRVFAVSGEIVVGTGKKLYGPGTLKALASFIVTDGQVVRLAGTAPKLQGIEIDISAVTAPKWIRGTGTTSSTDGTEVSFVAIKNATVNGMDFSAGGGTRTHNNLRITHCTVLDSGWDGITWEAGSNAIVADNNVRRCGYNCLAMWNVSHGNVTGNFFTKDAPPPIIYSGPGSNGGVEKGGLIYMAPTCNVINITGNSLLDNRNAGEDAIVVGEDGVTEFGAVNITGNHITLAGQFAIDVQSNFTVTGNHVYGCGETGIFIGRDLGGIIRNAVVVGNNVLNAGYVAGASGIKFTSNTGNLNTFQNILVEGNVVSDNRGTKLCAYGVTINKANATFSDVIVRDNLLTQVLTQGVFTLGAGTTSGVLAQNNTTGQQTLDVTAAGATPSVLVSDRISVNHVGATTITNLLDGYEGKEVWVLFLGSNTTTLALTGGNMYGNGGVNKVMTQFSTGRATKRGATWYWSFG